MQLLDLIRQKKELERKQQKIDNAKRVAVGSIIGVVAGVLLAPKSGKDTRKDIVNKAKETKDSALNTIKDSANTIKEVKEKITEEVVNKVGEFKDRDMFEIDINDKKIDKDENKFIEDENIEE